MKKAIITILCVSIAFATLAQGLSWTGINNKVITNVNLPLSLSNCSNVIILNCNIANSTSRGIYLYKCSNITILNCTFTNVIAGVVADHCGSGIIINSCAFKNMLGPMPSGQAIQFNTTNGINLIISNNTIINQLGQGSPEDAINMYKSNGTIESPILIAYNKIQGGGPSVSGGGIMLGDNGGSYQIARNNILVDPGQYGVAISGGDNISLVENSIYARQQPFTNVGLYVMNYSPIGKFTVKNNHINYTNKYGIKNNSWFGFGAPAGVIDDLALSADIIKQSN